MRKAQILANIKENDGNSWDKSRTCEKHRIDGETIKTRSHRLSHMFFMRKAVGTERGPKTMYLFSFRECGLKCRVILLSA